MAQTKSAEQTASQWLSLENELAVIVCIAIGLLLLGAFDTITVYWVAGWLGLVAWVMGLVESEDA